MKGIPVELAARSFQSNLSDLTNQERRVLAFMLQAVSCKETAWQLGIALSTTKNLRSRVLEKMMAENTRTLLRVAAQARRLYLAERGLPIEEGSSVPVSGESRSGILNS